MNKLTDTSLFEQELGMFNEFVSFKLRTKDTTCISKLNQLRNNTSRLPMSNIDVNNKLEFEKQLLEVFNNNPPTNNGSYTERVDLLVGFSEYLVSNSNKSLHWFSVEKGDISYNNILYIFYKLLVNINEDFLTDNEILTVYSVVENSLNYVLEVGLPSYFKAEQLASEILNMNNVLGSLNLALTVDIVLLDEARNLYQIVFLNQGRCCEGYTLGDVLRLTDFETGETTLDMLNDPSLEFPVVLGLQANNKPYIVDLGRETATLIIDDYPSENIGLSRLMLLNLVMMNHYRDLNITIIDTGRSSYWRRFSSLPHVSTLVNVLDDIMDTLKDIKTEMDRRVTFMKEHNFKNFGHLRSELKRTEQLELLVNYPYLTIVLDELTDTLFSLRWLYEDFPSKYTEIVNLLETITKDGRTLGVHLIAVGQWVQNDYLPKNMLTNTSLRIGKRLRKDTDYLTLYGTDFTPLKDLLTSNCSYVRTSQSKDVNSLKDAVIGGTNNEQIEKLIQYVYLHWISRSFE